MWEGCQNVDVLINVALDDVVLMWCINNMELGDMVWVWC
jgi:hypothetical protein